jgi:hypothetical protein
MIRLTFLGLIFSIFILVAADQVSAEVSKETEYAPDNLTERQKIEWEIGAYSGWLRLCGYGSKSAQISSFMKKSPFFQKGEIKMIKYDEGVGCTSSNEVFNLILGKKEQWIRYLDITYTPQGKNLTSSFDGVWTGSGQKESGSCGVSYEASKWARLGSFRIEMMILDQEITGRVIDARMDYNTGYRFSVDAFLRGTVSENGNFDLHVGKTNLGDEMVFRGVLPKDGDRAIGKWDTPNCHGKLSLTREFRVY